MPWISNCFEIRKLACSKEIVAVRLHHPAPCRKAVKLVSQIQSVDIVLRYLLPLPPQWRWGMSVWDTPFRAAYGHLADLPICD